MFWFLAVFFPRAFLRLEGFIVSRLLSQLFVVAFLMTVAGCGGGESTGHTTDTTSGGQASPAISEEMDATKMDEAMKQSSDSAKKTGK